MRVPYNHLSSVARMLVAETVSDAKDHANVVVRWAGGGGSEVLRLSFQEFEDQNDHPLRRRAARAEETGDDSGFRPGWPGFHGVEWRPAVQVHRSDLVRDQLRNAGGDRLLLGEADRRRRRRSAMRLARGQIRPFLASCAGEILRGMGQRPGWLAPRDARGN